MSSGFPNWAQTTQQQLDYLKIFNEKFGLDLTPDDMIPNEPRRHSAKLLQNILWGYGSCLTVASLWDHRLLFAGTSV